MVGGNWETVGAGKIVAWLHWVGTHSGAPPEWIGSVEDVFGGFPLDMTDIGATKDTTFSIEPLPFQEARYVVTYYLPSGTTAVRASGSVAARNVLLPAAGAAPEDIVDDPLSVSVPWVIAQTTWDEDQVSSDPDDPATVDPPDTGGWSPTGATLASGSLATSQGYVMPGDEDNSIVSDDWSFEAPATEKFQMLFYTPGTSAAGRYRTQVDAFSPILYHAIDWTFVEGDSSPGLDFLGDGFSANLNWAASIDGSDLVLLEAWVPEVTTVCEIATTSRSYVSGTLTAHDAAGNPVAITEIDPGAGTFELGESGLD